MRRFAVIGLGRFGSQLARALTRAGAEVIAIDKDRKIVDQIGDQVTVAVRLDSTEEDALLAQGIDKVDAAIIGIGQDFESNILTTVLLKSIGVKYICARAERQTHGRILKRIGADEIIFPEDESAMRWAFKLTAPQISDKLEFAPGFGLAQYHAPASFHGKLLRDLQLRNKYNVNLIAVKRGQNLPQSEKAQDQQIINVPLPETAIYEGDLLWLVGSDEDLAHLPEK